TFKRSAGAGGGSGLHQPVPHGPHARPAVAAAVPPAVAGDGLALGLPPLVEQELAGHAALDVIPGQRRDGIAATRGLADEVAAVGGERAAPGLLVVVLGPGVEAGAVAPRALDDVRGHAVATAERCLEGGGAGVVEGEPELPAAQRAAQVLVLDL